MHGIIKNIGTRYLMEVTMPIYEYDCRKCRESFTMIHSMNADNIKCPKCQSGDIKKKISSFNACSLSCGSGPSGGFQGG
jgi:putative FmdB family regulatory protein